MNRTLFHFLLALFGGGFALAFALICVPPFLENPDLLAAAAAGFVNPYSTGYSLDAVFCWLVLTAWILYEAREKGIRHGWIAILLGMVPGVATAFAFYLWLRQRQYSGR